MFKVDRHVWHWVFWWLSRKRTGMCLSFILWRWPCVFVVFSGSLPAGKSLIFIISSYPRYLLFAFLRIINFLQIIQHSIPRCSLYSVPVSMTCTPSHHLPRNLEFFFWSSLCHSLIISHILPSVTKIYHHFFAHILLNIHNRCFFQFAHISMIALYFSNSSKCLFSSFSFARMACSGQTVWIVWTEPTLPSSWSANVLLVFRYKCFGLWIICIYLCFTSK